MGMIEDIRNKKGVVVVMIRRVLLGLMRESKEILKSSGVLLHLIFAKGSFCRVDVVKLLP